MLNRSAWTWARGASAALALGCASTTEPPAGSESHFLMPCEETSECGDGLMCLDEVCTRACDGDAVCEALDRRASCAAPEDGVRVCAIVVDEHDGGGGPDASEDAGPDADANDASMPIELELGTSEPLGEEPVQVAFIAGVDSDEQIWLRGEAGTLRQITTWPVDPVRAESCGSQRSTDGYPSGSGRFGDVTFDPSGRFLVFYESLECFPNVRSRIIVHELATGRSRVISELTTSLAIVADHNAAFLITRDEDRVDLYDVDAAAGTLSRVQIPDGEVLGSSFGQLISLGESSLLVWPGLPVMTWTAGDLQLSELDGLLRVIDPDPSLGPLGSDALGTRLCVVVSDRIGTARMGLLLENGVVRMKQLSEGSFGSRCAIGADGRYVMFGTDAFELIDGAFTPVDTSFTSTPVYGAYGDAFYGVGPDGAIERLDVARDMQQTVIPIEAIEPLCGPDLSGGETTELIMPYDERPVAMVKRHCGCIDCDTSGSLALRLDTGAFETVETRMGEHDTYEVVWPVAGGALVFSTQSEPGGAQESTAEYVSVDALGSTESQEGLPEAPLLHGAAVPFRRSTANAAPASCTLEEITEMLLAGQTFEDCGEVPLGGELDAAQQCAADAYEAGTAFRLLWQLEGEDSFVQTGMVGRVTADGYELFELQYDLFGWVDVGTATFTACGTATCEGDPSLCQWPSCGGAQCRCMMHYESGNGVQLTCDAP